MDYLITYKDNQSTYLQHFGVKGMKWGVWNAETKARRELAKRLDSSTNDYTIKRGQPLQRLTFTIGKRDPKSGQYIENEKEDIKDLKLHGDESFKQKSYNVGKRTYVSINDADNDMYKRKYQPTSTVYNMKLSAIKDLQIAGGKKVVEEALKLKAADTENKKYAELAKKLSKSNISNMVELNNWLIRNDSYADRKSSYRPIDLDFYYQIDPSMGGPYANRIVKSLKKQGYSGMKDLWDGSAYAISLASNKSKRFGKKQVQQLLDNSRDPTIIFDNDRNLKIDDVTLYRRSGKIVND